MADVGGFGGGPDGDCCESDLKNISRFDCNWLVVASNEKRKEMKQKETKDKLKNQQN